MSINHFYGILSLISRVSYLRGLKQLDFDLEWKEREKKEHKRKKGEGEEEIRK